MNHLIISVILIRKTGMKENFIIHFLRICFEEKYQSENRLKNITITFALLAIIIWGPGNSGDGYLFSIDRRTKEIGIRRASGATTSELLIVLNKELILWVLVAFSIASPIAWYVMNNWLQNFVYKTIFSWWIFVIAGLIAIGIAY